MRYFLLEVREGLVKLLNFHAVFAAVLAKKFETESWNPSFLSARRERQDLIYHFRPGGKGQHKKVAGLRSSGNQFLSKQAKASEDAEKAAARAQQRADGAADLQKALGEMSEVAAAVHDSLHLSTNMFSTPLARRLRNAIRNSGLVCKLLPARKK